MSFHYKAIALMAFFIPFAACSNGEPAATPISPTAVPNSSAALSASPTYTPQVAKPTAVLSPPSEPADSDLSFIDNGQRLGAANSWDVALGDLDGDGDLDAFVANSVQSEAMNAIWMNDGRGFFTYSQQSGHGQGVALGDLDGDGDLDAVTTHWTGVEQSAIWLNDGSGVFTNSGQNLGVAFRPALGDLDGDSDLDIFMAQMAANTVWLNDSSGAFSDTGQRLGTAITAAIALGDLDGDGDLDALAGGWEEAAKVWLNDGDSVFSEHEQQLSPASVHIHDLALGDVDGDGDLDAFTAVASGDPNQVWFNDGSGTFNDSGQQLRSSLAHGVALGDLDGDGDLDALTTHGDLRSGSSGGKIWLNDGSGQFDESNLNLGNLYSVNAALGDLDGDGDLDAFIAHGETWQENGGELPNEIWLNEAIASAVSASTASFPSPLDGSGQIAFYSERDGNAEIYTMNPDGSDQRRLTFNQFDDVAPVWSPDGSQIVFLSNRDDPNPQGCFPECFYQIYIINADGSDERKLVETEFSAHHPDWHPNGTKLSFDTEFGLQGDIYMVNADGGGLELLIEDGFWADWSPNGSQVVFASKRDGEMDLYIANPDGTDQQRITNDLEMNIFPTWSPDGEKIAFVVIGPNFQNQDIFLINPDGSDRVQLTDKRQNVDEDPAWSPDGSQLVFQSDRDGNFEIYTMNSDGSVQQRLTNDRAGDYWPTWGPGTAAPP